MRQKGGGLLRRAEEQMHRGDVDDADLHAAFPRTVIGWIVLRSAGATTPGATAAAATTDATDVNADADDGFAFLRR